MVAELSHDQDEQVEEEYQPIRISMDEIAQRVDEFFPHRNENGTPSYREHQRETIIKVLETFIRKGTKFVALDGPVGCGKSAINYTVARVLNNTVYLTHLKQLQDQIAQENWEDLVMVKGRSAYCCNHVGNDQHEVKCNYDGEEHKMCRNSVSKYIPDANTERLMGRSIASVVNLYNKDDYLRMLHTGFHPDDDIPATLRTVADYYNNWLENRDLTRTTYPVWKAVGCKMGPWECPVKSTRILSKLAGIRLLNPDIFYLFNRLAEPYFPHNNLLIIDESHATENCIKRIFEVKLPVDTLYQLFGIDLRKLVEAPNMEEFIKVYNEIVPTYLAPALATLKVISGMRSLMGVTNYETFNSLNSSSEYAEALQFTGGDIHTARQFFRFQGTISMLDVVDNALMNRNVAIESFLIPLRDFIRGKFLEACGEYESKVDKFNIYESLVPAATAFFTRFGWGKIDEAKCLNIDRRVSQHLVKARRRLREFYDSVSVLSRIKNGDFPSFIAGTTDMRSTEEACRDTPMYGIVKKYKYRHAENRVLTITPIAINLILHMYFYSTARFVLMSTGTWIDPDATFRVLGIPQADSEYIKIKTTFHRDRRPVYFNSNPSWTNFSAKTDGRQYVYRTDEGSRKFCEELSQVVECARESVREKYPGEENTNIIVHCHSFDIARRVARHARIVDEDCLIQLPRSADPIMNEATGYVTSHIDKDVLLDRVKRNPNSGLTYVSTSVVEGVDFKYSIARVQIVLKKPIPSLGDPYVSTFHNGNPAVGIERDRGYLTRLVFTSIIQQYGRVMRAPDDWGFTIILDQAFERDFKGLASDRGIRTVREMNLKYFFDGLRSTRDHWENAQFNWPFKC